MHSLWGALAGVAIMGLVFAAMGFWLLTQDDPD
jgi:hypothetical protein